MSIRKVCLCAVAIRKQCLAELQQSAFLIDAVGVGAVLEGGGYGGLALEELYGDHFSQFGSQERIYGETMEVNVTEVTAYDPAQNRYAFSVDTLLASELREVVSVQIFAGDSPVSSTFRYSADTYGNNKNGDLLELCKALFAYSDSAKAYFTN